MEKNYLTPVEIIDATIQSGVKKSQLSVVNTFLLAIMAGVFIAFGSEASNMASFNLFMNADTYGLGKVLAGTIFGTGLILVVMTGGELFTGNSLMFASVLDKKITLSALLRNWSIAYIGNLVGSVFIAYMMNESGLFSSGANGLGATTIKIATYKVGLGFSQAFVMGIMCNWLVCLAVWMAMGAKDVAGKILGIFFPIWLFITSGFEHSIANMYYIPAGILAKGNEVFVEAAMANGVTLDALNNLNWATFFTKNLLPVTLGNVLGGCIFVSAVYWFVYKRNLGK